MNYIRIAAGILACGMLVACAPVNERPDQQSSQTTTAATTTQAPPQTIAPLDRPIFPAGSQCGIGEITETKSYTEGDYVILNTSLTLPVAYVEGNDRLATALNDYLNAFHKERKQEIDLLYRRYLADYQAGRKRLTTPSVRVRFELQYFTAEAVSITYRFTETTGDGVVNTHTHHTNIDLIVGAQIHLDALFTDSADEALQALLQTKLKESSVEGLYENALQNIAAILEDAWYLSDGKLIISLDAGKIAPLSSGAVKLTLTGEELSHLLSDYGKTLL